jgi:serine/threonine-protein kinase RsbW
MAALVADRTAPGRHSPQQTAHQVGLHLPRLAQSVGHVRRALDTVLAAFPVRADCRQRLAIAVSEACANAVEHADGTDEYHITARVEEGRCHVTITDHGCGFRPASAQPTPPPTSAETGRGLHLIAALADQFELHTRPGDGTQVRLSVDLA